MTRTKTPSLRFLGAAGTVTGSKYLLESAGRKILVDCGLFQGYKQLRSRNRSPLPVPASSIDAVVVSHAHLDHTGYQPALVRDGFDGPIHATRGTVQLCSLLLPDSGHLLEEEAKYAARRGSSVHYPPVPLYTAADAVKSMKHFTVQAFDEPFEAVPGITAKLTPAGHILGASQVHVGFEGIDVHFTGDLGRPDDPFMFPPRALEATAVLVMESTYGNRTHPVEDPGEVLGGLVNRVAKRGGVVLIAAFAVGRAETILLHLSRLRRQGRIPDLPVFLNSPMAIDASHIYRQHRGEHRLSDRDFSDMYALGTPTPSADSSKLLNLRGGPMVIISASGMLTGGRILHHIASYGRDPKNAIVLAGYQAAGTRGANLVNGERSLRIYGEDVPIRAEVAAMDGLSAHADSEDLLKWLGGAPTAPRMTYVPPQRARGLRRTAAAHQARTGVGRARA